MTALQEQAAAALRLDPAEPLIEFEGRLYTRGDIRRVGEEVVALLDASGANPRAPVVFIARTLPSHVATLLGLVSVGRNIQMVYPFQSAAGIAGNVERLKPAVVIAAGRDLGDEVRAAMKAQGTAGVVVEDMQARPLEGFERCTAPFEPPGPGAAPEPRIGVLTSGTTGAPKQYEISYESLGAMPALGGGDTARAPAFLYFPLGNMSGLYSYLPAVISGHRMLLIDRFSLEAWRDYVRKYRPERFGVPASGFQMLLDADVPKAELASIKSLATGAAPVDPTVLRAFLDRYGIPVLLSYGATEFCGPVSAMTVELYEEWGDKKFGSVGRPLPGAKLRVVDPETGKELPPGQEGVLEVVSPRVGPHWIHTADLAVIDEDGFLYIRGRLDGAIIRGGFKILPEAIERALAKHEAVSGAVVVGVPDRRLGQVPAAAVQLKPGAKPPTVEELSTHLRQHVLATYIPVHWKFVDELPRNATMKFDRPGTARLFTETEPA